MELSLNIWVYTARNANALNFFTMSCSNEALSRNDNKHAIRPTCKLLAVRDPKLQMAFAQDDACGWPVNTEHAGTSGRSAPRCHRAALFTEVREFAVYPVWKSIPKWNKYIRNIERAAPPAARLTGHALHPQGSPSGHPGVVGAFWEFLGRNFWRSKSHKCIM